MGEISQSHAARIRGVSRQRINELIKLGKLKTNGNGTLLEEDVLALETGKSGRPTLTPEERKARGLDDFKAGDLVQWMHQPRDAYGFHVYIQATVEKAAARRLLLSFTNPQGQQLSTWVSRANCINLSASDNEEL